ncbi:unnamed protein product [Echinostoma caproni]|uniref:Regulatory protein zeste n=1 Tax=Echinostoma caproni TaxID=27848 RepID=A0A183B482_9TREM|nr:unnamed protein product [Echinostoma caproni]
MSETDVLKRSRVDVEHPVRRGRVGPYTLPEKQALIDLVTQTRNSLRNIPTQMTADQYKQIWVNISNCMHAKGWPKRPWKGLRLKAQQMLSSSVENGYMRSFEGSPPTSHVGSCPALCPGVAVTVSSSSNVSSSVVSTPPPLLSSSEASAETVMRLTNSRCVNSVTSGNDAGGPLIVNVCSRAVNGSETVHKPVTTEQSSLPITSSTADGYRVLEVPNNDLILGGDRIELLDSSDDESDDTVRDDQRMDPHKSVQQDTPNVANAYTAMVPRRYVLF